jgi:hypothetical protein
MIKDDIIPKQLSRISKVVQKRSSGKLSGGRHTKTIAQVAINHVAVEKLNLSKLIEKTLRPTNDFLNFPDILYPTKFWRFGSKTGLFQQLLAIHSKSPLPSLRCKPLMRFFHQSSRDVKRPVFSRSVFNDANHAAEDSPYGGGVHSPKFRDFVGCEVAILRDGLLGGWLWYWCWFNYVALTRLLLQTQKSSCFHRRP